jgi:predicted tellurium resistance membrane protein TerC
MSTDNILAVAGVSKGNLFLLIFGLSIPFVVFTSSLLSKLMDRYPFIIYLGAMVLGRVGGEMMMTDPWVVTYLHPSQITEYAVQGVFAVGVIVAAKLWMRWRVAKKPAVVAAYENGPFYVAGWDLM